MYTNLLIWSGGGVSNYLLFLLVLFGGWKNSFGSTRGKLSEPSPQNCLPISCLDSTMSLWQVWYFWTAAMPIYCEISTLCLTRLCYCDGSAFYLSPQDNAPCFYEECNRGLFLRVIVGRCQLQRLLVENKNQIDARSSKGEANNTRCKRLMIISRQKGPSREVAATEMFGRAIKLCVCMYPW